MNIETKNEYKGYTVCRVSVQEKGQYRVRCTQGYRERRTVGGKASII